MRNEVILGRGSVKVFLSLGGWDIIKGNFEVRIVFTTLSHNAGGQTLNSEVFAATKPDDFMRVVRGVNNLVVAA
ncbi:hypothetical protein SAMN05444149_105414 [Pseudosulfitobacter pseudonitzschiae]|nr:hypothetical protein SAMN05444149_105414 [Pseudosulfitobacter pseudonitzschiae]